MKRLVSEDIQPVAGSFETAGMAAGGPGVPQEFDWRGRRYRVEKVLKAWRETAACRHGSGERYADKHWFEVVADSGETMTLYFERRPRKADGRRWRLFSMQ
jgi:phosphoribosylglycinamide formyltransferase-1